MSEQAPTQPAGDGPAAGSREAADDARAAPAGSAGLTAMTVPPWLEVAAGVAWRGLVLGAAVVAIVWLAARLALLTVPLIVAIILTTLTSPPTRWLEQRGLRPGAATTIVVFGGLTVLAVLLAALAPSFLEQMRELGPTLEEGRRELLAWLADSPLALEQESVNNLLNQLRDQLSESAGQIARQVVSGAAFIVELLAGAALVVVLVFFLTKDGQQITDWMVARTPERHRELLRATGRRAWNALGGYVRGTAAVAVIDAVGVGVGLLVIGVPLVLPLAIVVFLGAFLPIIGAFIAGLMAVIVAGASGGLLDAALTLAVIVVVQQVEGNILQPVIMRRAVQVHPVFVIGALTAGAAVGGLVGAFLAVPIAGVVAAVSNELRLRGTLGP